MADNDTTWDKLLQIKTSGRDDSNSDQYRYPYEPTPYSVLERLANSGLIRKKDVVLDYGCGKAVLSFSCPIRPRRIPWAWSMTSVFTKGRWRTKRLPFQGSGRSLSLRGRKSVACRRRSTVVISSIPFPWSYCEK